jgi:hypothetical protein
MLIVPLSLVHVAGVFKHWPVEPHDHTINTHTVSGELWAYIPQGSMTNLSSGSLLITFLQPTGNLNPNDPSEIHYYSDAGGTTFVEIDKAILKGNPQNPLTRTISTHYFGIRTVRLRYPYEWFGNVDAEINNGPLDFSSSKLEEFEEGESFC